MTRTTPERKSCAVCGGEYTVTAAGTIRHHLTDNPDFQAGPDSRKCRGAGEPPAGEGAEHEGPGQAQCRMCKHPAVLTSNGRVRSHLTTEQTPRQCPGGSDYPFGAYPDMAGTTDGRVATLAAECEHVPVGQCYGCYGESGKPVSDAELDAMAELGGTGKAPWGYAAETSAAPTMADQLKAVETDDFGRPAVRECFNCDTVGCTGCGEPTMDEDARTEAGRFLELAASGGLSRSNRAPTARRNGGLSDVERERLAVVAEGFRDARTSELTREAIAVLRQRTPEQKAETAARMDRTASQALGLPLDPALNHRYIDPSGVEWVHQGPGESCGAPDCRTPRNDRPVGFDPKCPGCSTDSHRCPGCDAVAPASRLPQGETADGPCDHTDELFDTVDGKPVCVACGTECTHPDGFTENDPEDDDGEGLISTCSICGVGDPGDEPQTGPVRLGDLDEGDHFIRRGTLMRLAERESSTSVLAEVLGGPHRGRTGELKNLNEVVERAARFVDPHAHEAAAAIAAEAAERDALDRAYHSIINQALADERVPLGHLEAGEHFVRRGTVMRVTDTLGGDVRAVVVEGPMAGRVGMLTDNHEAVERTHCRHEWVTETGPHSDEYPGPGCPYCGAFKSRMEQETKECTNDRMTERQRPSAAPSTTTAARPPGSPRATEASAPAVSPESKSVTSSAPTAKAAGNGRSAVATTDQQDAAARFLGGGGSSAPATPAAANQTDAAAQFLAGGSGAHGEKETKRDRFGRYLIPHPDTGKEQAWTRATTFAKSISDTYALGQWQLRMTLLGATMRPDIVQRAHGKHVKADKQLLDELTADLKSAAGDKVAANLGTAMHSFKELVDRAWHTPGGPRSVMDRVPPDCREDIGTYIGMLDELGLEPVPHLVEFTTVVKQYDVAGTSDNCYKVTKPLTLKIGRGVVRLSPGEYVIADLKTGRDLDYGWQEIAIQLAVYAQGFNTSGVWDRQAERWEPDPLSRFDEPGKKVRTDAGIVVHLPVDKSGKKSAAVYGIDLESGWNAAVLCERVRAWRKVRGLASPVMVSQTEETFAPARPESAVVTRTTIRPPSLMDRARAVTSNGEASAVWRDAKAGGASEAEVNGLVAVMQARLAELAEPAG